MIPAPKQSCPRDCHFQSAPANQSFPQSPRRPRSMKSRKTLSVRYGSVRLITTKLPEARGLTLRAGGPSGCIDARRSASNWWKIQLKSSDCWRTKRSRTTSKTKSRFISRHKRRILRQKVPNQRIAKTYSAHSGAQLHSQCAKLTA